jgi:hypothetical protein
MRMPRTARWLFLALAVVAACSPLLARAVGGDWPPLGTWLLPLVIGLLGVSLGRTWRRPVSREQLREYERWRSETELSDEERQAGVPEALNLDVDVDSSSAGAGGRRRRSVVETDPDAAAAAFGRARFVRWALGSTVFALAMFTVLPFGLLTGQYKTILAGIVLLLLAPFVAYLAFCSWWYAFRGSRFIPPHWLRRFGRRLDVALNKNVRI